MTCLVPGSEFVFYDLSRVFAVREVLVVGLGGYALAPNLLSLDFLLLAATNRLERHR